MDTIKKQIPTVQETYEKFKKVAKDRGETLAFAHNKALQIYIELGGENVPCDNSDINNSGSN